MTIPSYFPLILKKVCKNYLTRSIGRDIMNIISRDKTQNGLFSHKKLRILTKMKLRLKPVDDSKGTCALD